MALTLALTPEARSASLQWDANGSAAGIGGTGTWNTSSLTWSTGVAFQAWNNASLDDAVFGGTAGTVTLGVPITVHNLTFGTTGYTVTGGTLTLGGVSSSVSVLSGGVATIASPIAGSIGLTQAGLGTLVLTGANTYTGGTTISAGTLSLGSGGTTGSVAGNIVDNGVLIFNRSNALTYGGVDQRHRHRHQERRGHADADRRQHLYRHHDDRRRHALARQRRHHRQCRRQHRRQRRADLQPQRRADL